jgi:hypothetical protein
MAKRHEHHTPTPPHILRIGTTATHVDSTSKNGTRAPPARTPNQAINHSATDKTAKDTKTPAIALPRKHNTNRVFRQAPDSSGRQ